MVTFFRLFEFLKPLKKIHVPFYWKFACGTCFLMLWMLFESQCFRALGSLAGLELAFRARLATVSLGAIAVLSMISLSFKVILGSFMPLYHFIYKPFP